MPKMGRPTPEWLQNLKPGTYTMKELMEISGKGNVSIKDSLKRRGCVAEPLLDKKGEAVIKNGRIVFVYKWKGEKNKIGRPPPEWLLNLKPGQYTVRELIEISGGRTRQNVTAVLKKHGCRPIPTRNVEGGLVYVYDWKGVG